MDPGVRALQPRGGSLRAARPRDRPGAAVHAPVAQPPRLGPTLHEVDFYTQPHEALVLGYEEALTRRDSLTRRLLRLLGAHDLDRERTRGLDDATSRVLRGVSSRSASRSAPPHRPTSAGDVPGPQPRSVPGRLTLITRMGADRITDGLRPLLRAVTDADHPVTVGVRPDARQHLHARAAARPGTSTPSSPRSRASSTPTRPGTWPGGAWSDRRRRHQCLGGAEELVDDDLGLRYESMCDPPPTVASRSIWRSGSPSSSAADPPRVLGVPNDNPCRFRAKFSGHGVRLNVDPIGHVCETRPIRSGIRPGTDPTGSPHDHDRDRRAG